MDFMHQWAEKTGLSLSQLIAWSGIGRSRFYDWKQRYGKANEHNGKIPRDFWIEPWERAAILEYHDKYPLEGYRRLAFMMLDDESCNVAVSPSTVYRVLRTAGLLDRNTGKPSQKGKGFEQPARPHLQWHIDISYINTGGTFYYLCSILDGYSRTIVHHGLRESMTEADVEIILQRAREKVPGVKPRIISDNGPQFIAKDFKTFIRLTGMTHTRITPGYPQSNGKIERWHKSLKNNAIRVHWPKSRVEAERVIDAYVDYYNNHRLHSAIGYVTPADKLAGKERQIWAERDRKLASARERRRLRRQRQSLEPSTPSVL